MARFVIHPGFHKTGTTALQQALAQVRNQLLSQRILYPDLGGEAHHRIAFALNGRSWGWENRGGKRIDVSEWKQFLTQARNFDGTVILSSESLIELTSSQLIGMKQDLLNFETSVILTYRPLPTILVSIYQQYVKAGVQIDFDSWLIKEFSEGIKLRETRLWRRHSHDMLIERWRSVFGDVSVIVADPMNPSFLFRAFEKEIGISENLLQIENVFNKNRSLSLEELNLLLTINKTVYEKFNWDEYLYYVRSGIRSATKEISLADAGTRMGVPQWAFEAASLEHERQWNQISTFPIHIIGDSIEEQIASTLISDNKVSNGISDQFVGHFLAHLNFRESLMKTSTRTIIRELLVRIGFKRDSSILNLISVLTKRRNLLDE